MKIKKKFEIITYKSILRTFGIMQKRKESQARTKNACKNDWCGQDNLRLPVYKFETLTKWLDVDECHHPLKEYITAIEDFIWKLRPRTKGHIRNYFLLKDLRNDLLLLDRQIDRIMKKGGAR